MKVRYTKTALADIEQTFSYISQDDPAAASQVVIAVEKTIARLAEFPRSGVETSLPGVRVAVVYPYPYLVFYSIAGESLIIRNLRHGARRRTDSKR